MRHGTGLLLGCAPGVAPLTVLYFKNSGAGAIGDLQLNVAPADLDTLTGWQIVDNEATPAADQYSELIFNVLRAEATFGGTAQPNAAPSGDYWRTTTPISGHIAPGEWDIFTAINFPDGYPDGSWRLRYRIYYSANSDMSSATEITSGAAESSTYIAVVPRTPFVTTFTAGSISLTNKYIAVQAALRVIGPSTVGVSQTMKLTVGLIDGGSYILPPAGTNLHP